MTSQRGFSLTELLVAVSIAGIMLAALAGLLQRAADAREVAMDRDRRIREADFAAERLAHALRWSPRLLIPRPDDPGTVAVDESSRSLLAVSLPLSYDLDRDGVPDADDDADGAVDEDAPADSIADGMPGIAGFDDDGDGVVDEGGAAAMADDDEDGTDDEDPSDGIDDDGDAGIDEDRGADHNGDGAPGIAGRDDDLDGLVDEGAATDDDEDGVADEDPVDPLVFHLQGGDLYERIPVPWDVTGNAVVDAEDWEDHLLLEDVSAMSVELRPDTGQRWPLVDVSLTLVMPDGEPFTLEFTARLGAAM